MVGEPIVTVRVIVGASSHEVRHGITLKLMGALQQVLVVDDGHRAIDRSLAADLAGLGYASVTASIEAADDVLAVIARPAAILFQLSRGASPEIAALAARLREQMRAGGIPVIDMDDAGPRPGAPVDLKSRIGPYVLNEPDL
ncbi:hypothetical protein SAMN04488125_101401 [Methylorubrum salsuginis]|uniref:Uncharacterized protein n=2 Tax=Methylorubrum salsuginis TaxID=414703 RepID=A0A1I3YYA7_9HYPH|nr:hypothetical protein SAMN04488125_101401 [Methylorubrum salsuginis]